MLAGSPCAGATPGVAASVASRVAGLSASAFGAVASSRFERRTGSAMGSSLYENYCTKAEAEDSGTYGSTPLGYASSSSAMMASVLPVARIPSRCRRRWSVTTTPNRMQGSPGEDGTYFGNPLDDRALECAKSFSVKKVRCHFGTSVGVCC